MRAILDTHAVIWALQDDRRLSNKAKQFIMASYPEDLAISGVTLLEIAMLARKGSIQINVSIAQLLKGIESNFRVCPINASIASDAVDLPLAQSDPFDRTIAATARHYNATLVSKDRKIVESSCVETLW